MSAVGMTAENVAVPESDPVFSEVQLLPSSLKSFKRGYRISNELVRHSVLAIATVMGQAIVERTALEIDAAMLTGTRDQQHDHRVHLHGRHLRCHPRRQRGSHH
jgi:HK97 family phage major capsid protein